MTYSHFRICYLRSTASRSIPDIAAKTFDFQMVTKDTSGPL